MHTRSNWKWLCPKAGGTAFDTLILAGVSAILLLGGGVVAKDLPPVADGHLTEVTNLLDKLAVGEPIGYERLAIYPLKSTREEDMPGAWVALDEGLKQRVIRVTERSRGASVPEVTAENISVDEEYAMILSGEIVSGGRQTRAFRQDIVLRPKQKVDIGVFCVEARRWSGGGQFAAGQLMVPPSIQQQLRLGTDQGKIWESVGGKGRELGTKSATSSLEVLLKAGDVQEKLKKVREAVLPKLPDDLTGFIFVHRGKAIGAEIFGHKKLAAALAPKLIDAYAIDCVLLDKSSEKAVESIDQAVAKTFLTQVRAGNSEEVYVPQKGHTLKLQGKGLIGDGVICDGYAAHVGVQTVEPIGPLPRIVEDEPDDKPAGKGKAAANGSRSGSRGSKK